MFKGPASCQGLLAVAKKWQGPSTVVCTLVDSGNQGSSKPVQATTTKSGHMGERQETHSLIKIPLPRSLSETMTVMYQEDTAALVNLGDTFKSQQGTKNGLKLDSSEGCTIA